MNISRPEFGNSDDFREPYNARRECAGERYETAWCLQPNHDLAKFGFSGQEAVYWNYGAPMLYEESIARKEGRIAKGGALVVETGQHTGRSAADKFVVRTTETENTIWWDNNKPMTPEAFELLKADMLEHAKGKELFVQDLYGGADPANRIASRIVTEYAWHSAVHPQLADPP